MSKEMIINEPCIACGASQCAVQIDKGGWMTVMCISCGHVIAEGYALSPWELLKSKT